MSLKLIKAHLKTLQTSKPKSTKKSRKRKINPNKIRPGTIEYANKRRIVGPKAARVEGKRKTREIIQEIEREKEAKNKTARKNVKTVKALASRKTDVAAETLKKLLARRFKR